MGEKKTTAQEVREADALAASHRLNQLLKTLDAITGDMKVTDASLAVEALHDGQVADDVALLQNVRHRLQMVELDLTAALGKRVGRTVGNLSDGRQWKTERSADRKEWDHDGWKHDARRAVVDATLEEFGTTHLDVVDMDGEVSALALAPLLHNAITMAQEVHGSTQPRVTNLRALGLVTTDYCTSTPGPWRLNVIKPTEKKDTADE